jgi:hypothetical protein
MKHLFVSPERILLQRYKHDRMFRFAGWLVLCAVFLQLPFSLFGFSIWSRFQEQVGIQSRNQSRAAALRNQDANIRDLHQELEQIRQWEPILRSRIPTSAILSAIEKGIPSEVVLDSMIIQTGNYQPIPVGSGTYRVAQDYTVVLQAIAKPGSDGAIDRFKDRLAKTLPPGSEPVPMAPLEGRTDGAVPFQLQYSIKANGNYLSLGLTKIAGPDSL